MCMETNREIILSNIYTIYYLMVLQKQLNTHRSRIRYYVEVSTLRKRLQKSNKNGSKTSTYKIYEENYH